MSVTFHSYQMPEFLVEGSPRPKTLELTLWGLLTWLNNIFGRDRYISHVFQGISLNRLIRQKEQREGEEKRHVWKMLICGLSLLISSCSILFLLCNLKCWEDESVDYDSNLGHNFNKKI